MQDILVYNLKPLDAHCHIRNIQGFLTFAVEGWIDTSKIEKCVF
jgi:hypothetical protein